MLASFVALLTAAAPAAISATQPVASPAAECPRFGARPAGCIDPPLREQVQIYSTWRALDGSHPSDATAIRRPSIIGPFEEPASPGIFPAVLRSGAEGGAAEVTVRLIVGPDGAATSCAPMDSEAWLIGSGGALRTDLPNDPALGPAACALVRSSRTFRPAIDAAGQRIEAPIDVAVRYLRQRQQPGISPAPPPPSRFLGTSPYGATGDWPPRYTLTERINFIEPRFKDFLADRSGLPEKAVVGVVMDFATDGRALTCAVKKPAGDPRLDTASCAALMTVRNVPGRWQVRALPIEVSWTRDKGRVQLGTQTVLPGLAQPIAMLPGEIPAGDRPKYDVRVRILLDPAGKPVSCVVDGPSYADAFDAASCRIALARGRFTGAKDGFGRPASSGVDLRADWTRGQITLPGF